MSAWVIEQVKVLYIICQISLNWSRLEPYVKVQAHQNIVQINMILNPVTLNQAMF